eukprot:jgi/Astpho2/8363/Aster-01428
MQWPDRQTPGNTLLLLLHLAQSISWTQISVLLAVIWWMRSVHSNRLKTALREQRSRWDLLAQAEQNFTVAESFTLGWFNVLLRHLWPTLIEKEVSDSVTKELRVRAPCHGGLPAGSYDQPLCRWWFNMLPRHLWLTLIEKKASDHVNRELR